MSPQPIRRQREHGAAMTEYILIIALIAIASIGILTIFGDQLRSLFSTSAKELSGQQNVQHQDQTGAADGAVNKNLQNF